MTGREINDHHAHVNHHDDDLDDTLSHPELSNPHIVLSSLAGMTLTANKTFTSPPTQPCHHHNKDLSLATPQSTI
ncbi:Uncharacterised protein [Moraxella lacunata]|uniref:Uncharacterized protein n=1 Tax=Moraxella lacunata TaxID=477 RepID=A0A378TRC7_MORLA|nr:hypothetical protein [Moraxella lacunata]STZ63368.1 Uncharacterised protein [Moraxella lacunata]